MPTSALYDALHSFKDIHQVILRFAEDLDDGQLNWKPEGYSTSIGFHLWHLARESDFLKAAILHHNPQFVPEFGDGREIWQMDGLAGRWGFPEEARDTVGTGLSDEVPSTLRIPSKEELLGYLRWSYQTLEEFIELLDSRHSTFHVVYTDDLAPVEWITNSMVLNYVLFGDMEVLK